MRRMPLLYITFALFVALALATVIALPRIRSAIEASGVVPLIKNYLAQSEQVKEPIKVAFPLPDKTYQLYSVTAEGPTIYHRTLEALLKGVPSVALRDGGITYIPQKTKLRGVSVRRAVAYVDFSKEFLNPTVWENGYHLKMEQVWQTLKPLQIKKLFILVEGKLLD